jgi:hypothetical protein
MVKAICYGVGGLSVVALGVVVLREHERALQAGPLSPQNLPPPPGDPGGPVRMPPSSPMLVARTGKTYFVAVMTHGSANIASAVMVEDFARKKGFADVVVATHPVPHWPPMPRADFYVRGTLRAASSAAFPRHTGVLLGSVDVLDAWEV